MGSCSEKKLTVFTPTYNRAYILPQLHESLKKQTCKNFVWMIVDDGSIDNTQQLVLDWIDEQILDIVYIRQENGGKMKAVNTGVENTNTELFMCVDSDDWLVPTAVEIFLKHWDELLTEKKTRIAGLVAYRGKNEYEVMINEFPQGITESTFSHLYKAGFRGETTTAFKTEIKKQYPFPIIDGEKFITEAFIGDQLDQLYTFYLIPSITTVCEYRGDGLTHNTLEIAFENPCGYTAYFMQKANFAKSFKEKIAYYIRANCFRHKIIGKELPVIAENKILYNLTYPVGLLLFFYKKIKYIVTKKR